MVEDTPQFPHPSIVAAREALAERPPVIFESVQQQILAVREWHQRHTAGGSANSRPSTKRLPHPDDLAARAALAKRPPAPLEDVMVQAKASEEWRKRQSDGKSGSDS